MRDCHNDAPLSCLFSLSDLVETAQGDRVGLYRVPQVSPHEYLTFQWVAEREELDDGKKRIVFKRE